MESAGVPDAAFGETIRKLVKRLPQWLRADLASPDSLQRERAEEALFAMAMACLAMAMACLVGVDGSQRHRNVPE